MAAAVCFTKAPLLLGKAFFLVYEGVRRRPEVRRCSMPIWGGPTRPGTGAVWATSFGPPAPPRVHPFVQRASFPEKVTWYFFPDFISCKNSQRRDFAKNSVRISSFIQIWKDPGANYEAKWLEKWMHFGCISHVLKAP